MKSIETLNSFILRVNFYISFQTFCRFPPPIAVLDIRVVVGRSDHVLLGTILLAVDTRSYVPGRRVQSLSGTVFVRSLQHRVVLFSYEHPGRQRARGGDQRSAKKIPAHVEGNPVQRISIGKISM